jgi:tetratricopeptide (TPR) repeat protein
MKRLLVLIWLLCGTVGTVRAESPVSLDAALLQAQKAQQPLLIDFHAPWCYSCYYMQKHVLNGAEWQAAQGKMQVLEIDADTPEGSALRERYAVKMLPAYVLVDATGAERGRILGEQSREAFYPALTALLAQSDPLERLKDRPEAFTQVLKAYGARQDLAGALAWLNGREDTDAVHGNDENLKAFTRLVLAEAAPRKDFVRCINAWQTLEIFPQDCDSTYDADRALACTADVPPALRRPFLKQIQASYRPNPACADQRSAVFVQVDVAEGLGQPKAPVLKKAIRAIEAATLQAPAQDRNRADNLRVYYQALDDRAKLKKLLPLLIKAYPDDYVYPYRYGKLLAAQKQHAEALPYFEQAAGKAYGSNRLNVAEARALSLLALKQREAAQAVVEEAIEASGPFFPELQKKLKGVLG